MAITVNTSALLSSGGFDVQALVDAMIQANRAPEQIWKTELQSAQSQASALNSLGAQLASLRSDAQALNDYTGALAARTVTSSDQSVVTATAIAGSTLGEHLVTVSNLASKASYYSTTQVANADSVLTAGGTLAIKVGTGDAQTVDLGTYNTLNKIAAHINSLSTGVTASVINDSSGSILSIVGTNTGKANDVTLTTTTGAALSFKQTNSASDANYTLDGVPLTSATNRITEVLTGVTLQLEGHSSDPVDLSIAADTQAASRAVSNFVSHFNALISAINSQFAYNSSTNSAGVLSGDSVVRTLQEQLLQSISSSSSSSGRITGLYSLGITMNNDGTLSLDSPTLSSALSSSYPEVQDFFQNTSNGFALQMSNLLSSLTDSTDGPIVVELKGLTDSERSLNESINHFETNLGILRQQLVNQLTEASNALQQLPMRIAQIEAQLGIMPASNNKKS